jgi:uncharacterized membrane protein
MSELQRPSKRAQAWAELAGEVGVILLGALIFFALGWTFGVWLMVFGAIGFVITLVRSRRGRALGRPADG